MRPSPDVVTEILQKTNLSKSCEKSIDHRRLSMNRLTNTVPFWHGCCRNKTQHRDFCFKCYLSSVKLHSTLSEPTIVHDILLYNPVWKIIFTEVFFQRGHLLQKKFISRRIVKKVKKRAFLQRPERIRFLGRGKKSIQKCRNEPC